jgi:hypothetical protein
VRRINSIAVLQRDLNSNIVSRITALADPYHHRQAGRLGAQIRIRKKSVSRSSIGMVTHRESRLYI